MKCTSFGVRAKSIDFAFDFCFILHLFDPDSRLQFVAPLGCFFLMQCQVSILFLFVVDLMKIPTTSEVAHSHCRFLEEKTVMDTPPIFTKQFFDNSFST